MENGKHTKFILTPIFEILEDCVNATKGIGMGIENYPLCDYIMQTTFLKMTGASEQKLKCILWEIATNNFDFRYEFLRPQTNYGECSRLDEKNKVFKTLKEQIRIMNPSEDCFEKIFNNSTKTEILKTAEEDVINVFENTVLSVWVGKQFKFFKNSSNVFFKNHFCNCSNKKNEGPDVSLIEETIDYKRIVYEHRNRCAHNLKSYQTNLPDLSTLVNKDYDYENYFFRFSILVLLDEIFMKLYSEYLELLKDNI